MSATTSKKRPTSQRALTFHEQLIVMERARKRQAETAQWRAERKAARAERRAAAEPAAPLQPALPDLDLLTTRDRERCARAMGIDLPMPRGSHGLQPDARISAQLADRYIDGLRAVEAHEHAARIARVESQPFDARTAKPEAIREHMIKLGLIGG
jgi:hypothetical protein